MSAAYFILAAGLVLVAVATLRRSPFPMYGRAFAALVLFYGLLVKPAFVAIDVPSEEFVAEFVLAPLSISQYWTGSVLLLVCYALYVGAMVLTSQLLAHMRQASKLQLHARFSVPRSGALIGIGLLGAAAFFAANPELLSGASKNVLAAEDLGGYSGSGGLRLVVSVLYFIPFLMFANIRAGHRVHASLRLMWVAALTWLAFGFFSDQRGAILFSVFSWFIGYRTLVGKIGMKPLLAASGIALAMVLVRTVLRVVNSDEGVAAAAGEIVGNYIGRNLVENAKTLIIIGAIPEHLPYSYGGSYLDSILILIPRSLFPAKQTVNLDTIVGMSVFGCEVFGACGVPPGLIAESYLNFGILGLPVMMLLCGWFTAWLDWKAAGSSLLFRTFYAASLVYFGLSVLGSSISSFTTQAIMHAVILLPAWYALRRRTRRAATPAVPFASRPVS